MATEWRGNTQPPHPGVLIVCIGTQYEGKALFSLWKNWRF